MRLGNRSHDAGRALMLCGVGLWVAVMSPASIADAQAAAPTAPVAAEQTGPPAGVSPDPARSTVTFTVLQPRPRPIVSQPRPGRQLPVTGMAAVTIATIGALLVAAGAALRRSGRPTHARGRKP
jgi:hypothetical protein